MPRRLFVACFGCLATAVHGQTAVELPVKLAEFVVTPSQFGVADQRSASPASLSSTELDTLPQVGDETLKLGGLPCPIGRPAVVLLILFLGGIRLISVGILGEYIGRIYEEVRQRPRFIVDRAEGFSADASRK